MNKKAPQILYVPLISILGSIVVSYAGSMVRPERSKPLSPKNVSSSLPVIAPAQPASLLNVNEQVADKFGQRAIPSGIIQALGINSPQNRIQNSLRRAKASERIESAQESPAAGEPDIIPANAAYSAALITTEAVIDTGNHEVTLLADWDGREDCQADRRHTVANLPVPKIDLTFTRAAISEHTIANGFNENIFYYGDIVGNFYVNSSTASTSTENVINLSTLINVGTSAGVVLLNPTGGDCAGDTMIVTGIAVNPVADLGEFGMCGTLGEVVYVSAFDSEGCVPAPIRTRIFAFGFTDSASGFGGVTCVGAFQILRHQLSNVAGIAVDDDGSLYFQLVDLLTLTNGAAIFKAAEVPRTICSTPGRINRFVPPITASFDLTLTTPIIADGVRLTNYSGTSTTFGNAVALAAGSSNVIYAALSRSAGSGGGVTEGMFAAPPQFANGLPSMIISFADCGGLFDPCSSPGMGFPGTLSVGNGVAEAAQAGITLNPGVNNFRVFALGNGPDIRPPVGNPPPVATISTLKLDMQIDFSIFSGLAVDEEQKVFVVSGGVPAGVGTNPSPLLGEILCFDDGCPADRRADFVDQRGNTVTGNVGDGDSDRFDHIFWQAPNDVTSTPKGVAGIGRGFLRYTNRLAPNALSPGVLLGTNGGPAVQDDDDSHGPIVFEAFDPSHQVAGGDDANTPFRGDDSPAGGFEFTFGGPVGAPNCVWNSFFLNSNGSITFSAGDLDHTPTVVEFRAGLPKLAAAWADLNPNSRTINLGTFPVQAMGFAGINDFKIRWINVPEFDFEACGSSNTFSIYLFDDGTFNDENATLTMEGPTNLRFTREPNTSVIAGCAPRTEGSGAFSFQYGRMDLLGTANRPVITGYSIGNLVPTNPPGLCEIDLGEAARLSDAGAFGVIQGQTASIKPCLVGEGTEPTIFELFNEGTDGSIGGGGEIIFATPDFDLRFEGNDSASCTSIRQVDLNRSWVSFYGVGCDRPANPIGLTVSTGPFVTTPSTTGLINVLRTAQLNMVGCGFFPNEATVVCQGDTGPRPGKTVSTAMSLVCDSNGDGISEAVIALTSVIPFNPNLVRGTLAPISNLPGTPFPLACCGGLANVVAVTTFTSGDNNIFGAFTRTAIGIINLGIRAPVVSSVSMTSGDCLQAANLTLSGGCFLQGSGANNVTSVFAVELTNPANIVQASQFAIVNTNLINATFNLGEANAGKTFLIFASGPNGTSRNLTTLPPGSPPGTPLGNEAGLQVTFSCNPCISSCAASSPGLASAGSMVAFTGSATNACATPAAFDWDFGDGTPHSSLQNPSHVYTAPGVYTWSVAVSGGGMGTCVKSGTISITTSAPLIGSFSPAGGLRGTPVIVSGLNFNGATAVRFNGVNASFVVDSPSQITATVPFGATTGPISVETPAGTATSSSSFIIGSVIITVNSSSDTNTRDGLITLREAILIANGSLLKTTLSPQEQGLVIGSPTGPSLDAIRFSIGSGPQTINVGSSGLGPLPPITGPVSIDATTQPGLGALPIIELNGASAGPNATGLRISAGRSIVRGLVINRFSSDGILLETRGANLIEACLIGTGINGNTDQGNGRHGVSLINSDSNLIGGTSAASQNIISGNAGRGVSIVGNLNKVQGNSIGVALDGLTPLGNDLEGVSFFGSDNTIGARLNLDQTLSGLGNLIAFNRTGVRGLESQAGDESAGNSILSNLIFSNQMDQIQLQNSCPSTGCSPPLANDGQAPPVLDSVTFDKDKGELTIMGEVRGDSNTDYFLQFFLFQQCPGGTPSGSPQRLNSLPIARRTDGAGSNRFTIMIELSSDASGFVNCTATDPLNNTSPFSACAQVNGGCIFTIIPTSLFFPSEGGMNGVSVLAQTGCNWNAVSNNPNFISITSGTTGSGLGTVLYTVGANTTGSPRTGTMTIAGQTFNVSQNAQSCSFLLSQSSQNFTQEGGTGNLTVTAPAGCSWTAVSNNAEFITILTPSSGGATGNGTVSFIVERNIGSPRTGTMTIAGQTFNVSQAGGCSFSIDSPGQSFSANQATGVIQVIAGEGCNWTALSNNPDFITITSGSSGSGEGTVGYTVAANPLSTPRNGTITVAGLTFTVFQGALFGDVPQNHPFFTEIGKLSSRAVTLGCGAGNYCPDQPVLRDQMAAFIIRARGELNPPFPPQQRFPDVPPTSPFYSFVDRMAELQITLGCGGGNYCPSQPVLREQMAAFIIRGLSIFNPPEPAGQRFADVPPTNLFYRFIEEMALRQITLGCGAGAYCPAQSVTRGQMAAFLVRAFNL